ncbi:MAG: cytochrome c [Chitinophagaceae bacterium]
MVLVTLMLTAANVSWAEPAAQNAPMKGDATQGKALFNGKGICHYCHGIDGVIDRKPKLEPETQAVVARLGAAAPDLRNRAALTLKDNKARFRTIREGHPGSGMFPDTTLSDQDIKDVLAYLATLRQSAPSPGKSPY